MKPHAGLLKQPSCALALSFGAGLSPWAPGTIGALVAFPLCAVLRLAPPPLIAVTLVIFLVVGCMACGKACRVLGEQDHGSIVWDETFGMLLVLLCVPFSPWWWLLAFAAFRFFDILKPWPIRLADVYTGGGIAVMLDDVLAAIYAIAVLWLAEILLGSLFTG
jgi:phosphatidylglycerophosphatase A